MLVTGAKQWWDFDRQSLSGATPTWSPFPSRSRDISPIAFASNDNSDTGEAEADVPVPSSFMVSTVANANFCAEDSGNPAGLKAVVTCASL